MSALQNPETDDNTKSVLLTSAARGSPFRPYLISAILLALIPSLWAQEPSEYQRLELSIPVRDGARLFAVALTPKGATHPLPILLIRTPFGAAGEFPAAELPAAYRELGRDGYIFVDQDIRGRFGSEGEFVSLRPQKDPRNSAGTNESTDAYDSIDWLVKNLPGNNGKVGVLGISYRGWLAALAGVGAHPALKAISPQAPVTDAWLGDDFYHQGAFRQTQGVEYTAIIEKDPKGFTAFTIPDPDHYDFYLRLLTLDSVAESAGVFSLPSWVGFRSHPEYDAYWRSRALQNVLTRAEVPMLFVGGFWDQEDLLGPQLAYRTVEKTDTHDWNRIVLGPWFHGGWALPGGDSLGPIRLGAKTADYFREQIQRPWFAYYLHDKDKGRFPEAWIFETGANEWHTFDRWPPRTAKARNLYLRENGKIGFQPASSSVAGNQPPGSPGYDSLLADPSHPVPYISRPDDGSGWRTWLVQDQRFVEGRADVVTWKSEPLTQDLTIAGAVMAHLFASTSGSDADWVVKLIDVYPDSASDRSRMAGYELMVSADIMRGRYWKAFSRATPIPPNTVTPFNVDLHQQLYRFKKGHRIMVQIQSSWFPLYDRNPQTFVNNIFQAGPSDFRIQKHRIWHTARYPSHISVSVLP